MRRSIGDGGRVQGGRGSDDGGLVLEKGGGALGDAGGRVHGGGTRQGRWRRRLEKGGSWGPARAGGAALPIHGGWTAGRRKGGGGLANRASRRSVPGALGLLAGRRGRPRGGLEGARDWRCGRRRESRQRDRGERERCEGIGTERREMRDWVRDGVARAGMWESGSSVAAAHEGKEREELRVGGEERLRLG